MYVIDLSHKQNFSVQPAPVSQPKPVYERVFVAEGACGVKSSPLSAEPVVTVPNVAQVPSDQPGISDSLLWHRRLGHISKTTLCYTYPAVQGLPALDMLQHTYERPCGECLDGRFVMGSHNKLHEKPACPCDLLYADVMGPFTKGIEGSVYALSVVDAHSGFAIVTPIKSKDAVLPALMGSIERFQQLCHTDVKELRTDYGSEFHNDALITYLSDKHIKLSHSTPYIHQQVGLVERFHRTVMETCRSLLSQFQKVICFVALCFNYCCISVQ
jgi:transposase InsO family protein